MNTSRLLSIGSLLLPLMLAGCTAEPGDSVGDGDGEDVADRGSCDALIECASALAPESRDEFEATYGEDGTCWENGPDVWEACQSACDDAIVTLEELAVATGEPLCNGDPTGPIDTDGDGLNDEEEAELGTDPELKDTDEDNYWDSWEVIEGTDPLDYESRIYVGFWPYNPDKDELEQGSWATASTQLEKPFPRDSFLDQHGDMVDLYDFTNFTSNATGEPAYFIFDLSAQWCGPCHNVANWIKGVDDANTSWIQDLYPTVREKVHGLRIWWLTFIVEANDGSPPTIDDATTWYQIHADPFIPIMVDADLNARNNFMGPAFPHFFLLDPEMKMEYFPGPADSTNDNPYPAVGLVDEYL